MDTYFGKVDCRWFDEPTYIYTTDTGKWVLQNSTRRTVCDSLDFVMLEITMKMIALIKK